MKIICATLGEPTFGTPKKRGPGAQGDQVVVTVVRVLVPSRHEAHVGKPKPTSRSPWKLWNHGGNDAHMLHVAGIFTNIYPINDPNVC